MKIFELKEFAAYKDIIPFDAPIVSCLLKHGLNHFPPRDFEDLIMKSLAVYGFKGDLTPASGDDGIDILLHGPHSGSIIVQCKRYTEETRIAPSIMRELIGSMVHVSARYGILVTTSYLSEQAAAFCHDKDIIIVDRDDLDTLLRHAVTVESAKYRNLITVEPRYRDKGITGYNVK